MSVDACLDAVRRLANVVDVPGAPTTLRLEQVNSTADGFKLRWSCFDPIAWANRDLPSKEQARMRGTVRVGLKVGDPETTARAWWARTQLAAARRYARHLDADWEPGVPWVNRTWTIDEAWKALTEYLTGPRRRVHTEEDGVHVSFDDPDRLDEVYEFKPREWAAYLREFTSTTLGPLEPGQVGDSEIVPAAIPLIDGLPLFVTDELSEMMGSKGPAVTLVDGRIVRAPHRPLWSRPLPAPTERPTLRGDLQIVIDTSRPDDPTVRLLVDGFDVLDPERFDTGYDPDSLLGTGDLVPTDPPHRVGLYHCKCDTLFCESIAGIIVRRGDRIEWTDFRSLTGQYDDNPTSIDGLTDPYATDTDGTFEPSALDLPTISFDANQYLAEVARATADRAWETPIRALCRLVMTARPPWHLWTGRSEDELTVDTNATRDSRGVLRVPPGNPEQLAASLIELLDAGHHPRTIAEQSLWH
ncbi:hypothetical protein [Solicola sp. PLA-1-18]|uniref:hypothetical protein n=1 Tax=Solicola sp. PLA-1-18 TaxID=3380532 RepID=UPI003B7748E3